MESQQDLRKQIRDLISNNRTEKALALLAKTQLSSLDRDLIIINSRFNKVKEDQRMGIINKEEASQELNKINVALLDLSEKIGVNLTDIAPGITLKKGSGPKFNKNILFIAAGVLALVLLSVIAFNALTSDDSHDHDPEVPLNPEPGTKDQILANFHWSCPDDNCTALSEIQFSNSSQNASRYQWEFGDGQSSLEKSPVHKYAEDKTYTVRLTVLGEGTFHETTQDIVIRAAPPVKPGEDPLPVAMFDMDKATCVAPCKVAFSNLSQNASTVSWEINDKPAGGDNNLVYTFKDAGTYRIKLIASNGSKEETYQQTVQITAAPTPPVAGTPPAANEIITSLDPKTVYQIVSTAKGTGLQPTSSKDEANITLGALSAKTSHFTFSAAGDGCFFINNVANNKRIVVAYASTDSGIPLFLFTAYGNDNEKFRLEKLSNGSLLIVNKRSGKAFDIGEARVTQQPSDNNNPSQQFRLARVVPEPVSITPGSLRPDAAYQIVSAAKQTNSLQPKHGNNGALIVLGTAGSKASRLSLTVAENGYFFITNLANNQRMVIHNASKDTGAPLIQWPAADNDNERFQFEQLSNGSLLIINKNSGKALDVSQGGITQQPINRNSDSQQFLIIKE